MLYHFDVICHSIYGTWNKFRLIWLSFRIDSETEMNDMFSEIDIVFGVEMFLCLNQKMMMASWRDVYLFPSSSLFFGFINFIFSWLFLEIFRLELRQVIYVINSFIKIFMSTENLKKLKRTVHSVNLLAFLVHHAVRCNECISFDVVFSFVFHKIGRSVGIKPPTTVHEMGRKGADGITLSFDQFDCFYFLLAIKINCSEFVSNLFSHILKRP